MASSENLAGKLVVLVEDDPAILAALSMLLDSWGLRAVETRSEAEVAALLNSSSGPRPDLVIADYYLDGEGNGREVVEKIRARYATGIPAIVLTGDTSSELLDETKAANCRLLIKPVQPEDLRQAVEDLLR